MISDDYYIYCDNRSLRYIKYCCETPINCIECILTTSDFKNLNSMKAISLKLGRVLVILEE